LATIKDKTYPAGMPSPRGATASLTEVASPALLWEGGRLVAAPQPLADFHAGIDNRLTALLSAREPFGDAYQYLLARPGKRVRGGITRACIGLFPRLDSGVTRAGVSTADALDLACGVEMLHEASLVHDDICDGSAIRRGAPSVPATFGVRHAALAGLHLAGIALHLFADVLDRNPEVRARLAETGDLPRVGDLARGQLLESLPPCGDDISVFRRHYRSVAVAKTGTLFRVACCYGGTAAGCDSRQLSALQVYADHLAIAFQIMDDIRDLAVTTPQGRPIGTDVGHQIPTWPVIEWLAQHPGAIDTWRAARGRQLSQTHRHAVCAEVVASGAAERAQVEAARNARAARDALAGFPDTAGHRHLAGLCAAVVAR
jgi:geranylgeranyl pyrophosphate synthase